MNTRFALHMAVAIASALALTDTSEARERGPVKPVVKRADTSAAAAAAPAPTRPTEVRVVYYSGDVSIRDSATTLPLSLGIELDSLHQIIIGRGASVQLAVDGRLVVVERPGSLKRADVIRRASGEPNEELMAALRALATQGDFMASTSVNPARMHAALAAAMTPQARGRFGNPTGMLVPLEPRSTAVTRGPLRFRWLRSADTATYRIVVRDRFDNEILRAETSDTTLRWEAAQLFVGSTYTWTLARLDDTAAAVTSTFHRLDDLQGMRLEGGESRIRLALGSENPALPIALGAHFALHGCYADAARQFTSAALGSREHFDRFLRLAREQYARNIKLSPAELEHVQSLGAMTMN